jgi:peptide/nickel transport system ATP-binding protein
MTLSVSGLSAVHPDRTILHPTSPWIEPGTRIGLVGSTCSGRPTLGHALICANAHGDKADACCSGL